MDSFEAVGICEGFIECDDESKILEAWQHLIDTGRHGHYKVVLVAWQDN